MVARFAVVYCGKRAYLWIRFRHAFEVLLASHVFPVQFVGDEVLERAAHDGASEGIWSLRVGI